MKIQIIEYNKMQVKKGRIIILLSTLALILFCFIDKLIEEYTKYFVITTLLGCFFGFFLIVYGSSKYKTIGYINFEKNEYCAYFNDGNIIIIKDLIHINLSKYGYLGQSNYTPFLTVGSLSYNSGINVMEFKCDNVVYEFDILIRSEYQYESINEIVKEFNNSKIS